jgi:hypothetical protein
MCLARSSIVLGDFDVLDFVEILVGANWKGFLRLSLVTCPAAKPSER